MSKILITGANGQLGSELTLELRKMVGSENVIASDIRESVKTQSDGPFVKLDVMNVERYEEIIEQYQITEIYHLAALLSASAEKNMVTAWNLNMAGLMNTLQLAKKRELQKIFWPSSIAVFGPDAIKKNTPQNSPCNPTTVYGISKVAGELWCAYFYQKFGVDVRSIRYPGLVGYKSLPGGGTTDYAVDIFHKAVNGDPFICFLDRNSALPMMYMSDAVKAAIDLMNAPSESLTVRTSYNISAISFTPEEIASAIQKHIPDFKIRYEPDYRQEIADSWPDSIDDSVSRREWGWRPEFDLHKMTVDILRNLPDRIEKV